MKLKYIIVAVIISGLFSVWYIDNGLNVLAEACPGGGVPIKGDCEDPLPDPNRDYYDGKGGRYDYTGKSYVNSKSTELEAGPAPIVNEIVSKDWGK